MVLHDQHVHTNYSRDSLQDLEQYFIKAKKLGCDYVMTCEHTDFDSPLDGVSYVADYSSLKKDMERFSNIYNIKNLIGIELGFREDHINELNEVKNSLDFDVVNLSVHDDGHYDFYLKTFFIEDGADNVLKAYFTYLIKASKSIVDYDVLSHIDYGFKTAKMVDNSLDIKKYENELTIIMKNIINRNKALEINIKVQKTINDDNHLRYILTLYKSLGGVKLTLSSDSHIINDYRNRFEHYMDIIKECGFDDLSYFIKRKEYLYRIK